ncbi:hypothetical protein [Ectothiorhodospira mobilis]|uniref:hypothetical protein n=1 Tax=Ectothiorhodospira mobilis TaxID=195064 RepID=UPI0019057E47|nr:hypothetical protein [Ectothiorhodospira mobilis]MBK1691199.1 hypothetical protein [Ectothiorhodospira mobilis]
MALAESDLELIRNDIKEHLGEWLAEQSLGKPPAVYEIELRERMVRVEEELKHQRELMREGFAQMDRRFEAMREDMDKRFEQVERRFEQVDQRFEQMERRFDRNDVRFDMLIKRQDRQFYWVLGFIATSLGLTLAALRFMV